MSLRHAVGPKRKLNCFLGFLFLLFTGRLRWFKVRWPFHFLARTKRGNWLHFRATPKRVKDCGILWFEGQYEVISKRFAFGCRRH